MIEKDNEVKNMYVKYLRQGNDEIKKINKRDECPDYKIPIKNIFPIANYKSKVKTIKEKQA